jgi:phage repressor protein C with HTH and peptisase S24 domain
MIYLGKNLKLLRQKKAINQQELAIQVNKGHTTIGNWEKGISEPNLSEILILSNYFEITPVQLVYLDLDKVEVNKNTGDSKKSKLVEVKHEPSVEVKTNLERILPVFSLSDKQADYGKNTTIIPLTDISVAAGLGLYNDSSYLENVESIAVPNSFLSRKQGTRLSVRVKGPSMAPTIYDGSYVSVRLLDRSEWAKMPDGLVYVVTDKDGKSYLKRVKNRFKNDFIVLTSDNPDKANFSNFNLQTDEIQWIWEAEFYMSFRMPNAQDSYYNKLIELEEKVDNLMNAQTKRLKEK